jgi:hypothetical protein
MDSTYKIKVPFAPIKGKKIGTGFFNTIESQPIS